MMACNFDSAATCDNGSCAYATSSSVDIIADSLSLEAGLVFMDTVYFEVGSYAYIATNDQGCDSIITVNIFDSTLTGCTVMSACNYNVYAGINDSSLCSFPGCMDIAACNYDAGAICDNDVVCTYYGCIDPVACNYDATASCDNGSCTYGGCTNPAACNYDAAAGCDNASCILPNGCTDETACNFDPAATCDDNSCTFEVLISETIEADSLALDSGVVIGNQTVFVPGTYTDTIDVANGCDTIMEYLVVLGNSELSQFSNVSLYPNPSNTFFQLSLGNAESHRIEIYDISSRRVFDVTQDQRGTITFDVNNYAPGYYFMRIHLDSRVLLQRFEVVKQNLNS